MATCTDIEKVGDQLRDLIAKTTVFARVSPEHKALIVRAQRKAGTDVAFLGDGVNDAVALHAADVGISMDSATDVAKDAADVLLLEKDLDVLAVLGFQPLPGLFFLTLAGLVIAYLGLIEIGKHWFYRSGRTATAPPRRHRIAGYRVRRRAARFSTVRRLGGKSRG